MPAAQLALPAALAGVAWGILVTERAAANPAVLLAAPVVAGALALVVPLVPRRVGAAVLVAGLVVAGWSAGAWRQSGEVARALDAESVASLADGAEHDLVGTVQGDPRPREDRLQAVVGDLLVAREGAWAPMADRLLLWLPRGIALDGGDRIRFSARLRLAEDFDGFAYREYLARQGIGAIGEARAADVAGREGGPSAAILGLRDALLTGLNRIVPEPEAALGAGILLGVRTAIAPEIDEAFERAGLTHVVAISGWNIAIVAGLVGAAARPLERRAGRVATAALVAATVAGYVVLTGATPSVVRAALMAGALVVARLGGSPAHAASALGLAALVMLVAAPSVLWDIGFQLSLLATAGVLWFGAPIERRLAAWPALVREPIALTLAAQITTLPVILVNFERLSLVAPIANVLVVPLVPLAMLLSAIAAVTGVVASTVPVPVVSDGLAWLAGGAAWLVLKAMIFLGTTVASIPYASVDVSVPAPIAVAWLPIVALAGWALAPGPPKSEAGAAESAGSASRAGLADVARRVTRPLPIAAGLVVALGLASVAQAADGRLHVTVLDVGQGDAILIEAPTGATMLVDGGPDPDRTLRRLGAHLPFHERSLDVLLLSHPHQDHVAGLVSVVERFRVGTLLHAGIAFENQAYDELLARAAGQGVRVEVARAGQVAWLDGSTGVEVLYPSEADATAPLPEGDINNGSIVVVVRHGRFAALLTGDAEEPIEAALVGRGLVTDVDVLKVGHHGSASSTTPALLAAATPEVAIISAGVDNEYGHPAPRTLDALAADGDRAVLRTDLDGDVEISTDGRTYRVRTSDGWSADGVAGASGGGAGDARSIGPCQSRTAQPRAASSPMPACPMGSSSTPRASPAWPSPRRRSSRRRASRSTGRWSKPPRSCTTSTSRRSAAPAASTAWSVPGGSSSRATPSSPCRSPPTP